MARSSGDVRRGGRARLGQVVLLALLALVVAMAPLPSAWIERWYSTGIYPWLQRILTPAANLVSFAIFDLILLVVIGTAAGVAMRGVMAARRTRTWRPLWTRVSSLVAIVAVVYLGFALIWGLNYRRTPMAARIALRDAPPRASDVLALGLRSAGELNALHAAAHATGWPSDEWTNAALRRAFDETHASLVDAPPIVPGRLKWTALGPYFRWTGVDGMVDPFALEVLVNPDLLPWERPFVAAHEWAHLAGFGDESEASFVGWLTCLRADAAARYSGWLAVFWQVAGEVVGKDRNSLWAALDAGPRQDVDAVIARLRRGQLPWLRSASWAAYDQYLRANRVDEGVRSYSAVIDLILRARLQDDGRPIRVSSR